MTKQSLSPTALFPSTGHIPQPLIVNPSPPAARLGGGGRPGGGVVVSPPGSARADARLVYRPQACLPAAAAQARTARQPAVGPSAALTRSSRRRAGPWSAEAAAAAAGEGVTAAATAAAGGGVTAAAAGQVRPGKGRRRGGAGLRPGPRLSAPSRLRSSGRWRGRQRASPGEGGGRAEDSSLSRLTCLESPHPPLPNHPFRSNSRLRTRSCGPDRRRDHCSLAPARAPVPSAATAAAAASSAAPRRRAHDRVAPPPPLRSPRPAGSAAATAAARRAATETRMSLGRNCGEGWRAGEGPPQMTSLPYPASFSAAAAAAAAAAVALRPGAPGRSRRERPGSG
nr:translation initiation factor IF-2-like [Gorilla gorilla gorilla]